MDLEGSLEDFNGNVWTEKRLKGVYAKFKSEKSFKRVCDFLDGIFEQKLQKTAKYQIHQA